MTVPEIMDELQARGSDSIKKILLKHGVKEPLFGVKIEYLKPIQKKIKMDYQLAKDLYATGNADAMYLAGLIADDEQMTRADLQTWAEQALSHNISEYTVPWVAAGGRYGFEMALKWIADKEMHIRASGWATLANVVAISPDQELDMPVLKDLLQTVTELIHTADNRVKYTMNSFVIAVGTYVVPLSTDAVAAALKIGVVTIDKNGTACKVPDAESSILKVQDKGTAGKKKKILKC